MVVDAEISIIDGPNRRRDDGKGLVDPPGPELGFVRSLLQDNEAE